MTNLEDIVASDGRYHRAAAVFLYDSLNYTVESLSKTVGHVSGQLLCEGLRRKAVKRWGGLSRMVFASWHITCTRDFGELVFLLIRHGWLSAQPTDCIEDFDNVFDFATDFK